jgi:hypothetical protein
MELTLEANNSSMYTYDTVSSAVNGLKKRGFSLDFNLAENCLVCQGDKFNADDFEIVEWYRFEGESDPADEAVVYAIESNKGQKGVLVNGYGPSADSASSEIAKKLHVHKN